MAASPTSWYSIISYIPNTLRNERLNIGCIIHNSEEGKIDYFLLPEKNKKFHSILTNDIAIQEYKLKRDLIIYKLNACENDRLADYSLYSKDLIEVLSEDFSPNFIFSKKQPIFSQHNKQILDKLLEIYVDKNFITSKDFSSTVKQSVKSIFKEHNLLGKKIKSDILITPIKEITHLNYKIDFAYKNDDLHLIQTVPKNPDSLNDWFSKLHLFQQELNGQHALQIIYDVNKIEDFETASNLLGYLNKDSSTEIIDFNSNEFELLCTHISEESIDVDSYKLADVI